MSLQVRALTAGYWRGPDVLRGVDLDVGADELVTVLGASGSGKSTLLRVLAGLHPVRSGRVVVAGHDLTHAPPERRGIGLVPQDGALFGHLTVAQNVAYALPRVRGRAAARRHPRVRELLDLVGLADLTDRLPHELSGGQVQRVALARALAPRPRLVALDEPFSALDAALRQELRAHVRRALREAGTPAVLITHDQDEALSVSDRVAVLRDGVVVQSGAPQDVYRAPADTATAVFLGGAVLVPAHASGGTVCTPVGTFACTADGPVVVVLRHEQLEAAPDAHGEGRVVDVEYFGHDCLVHVRVPQGPALVCRRAAPLAPGTPVTVTVRGPVHVLPA